MGSSGGRRRHLRGVGAAMDLTDALATIEGEVVVCRRCPRLVAWRERVADEKVARFAAEAYWGRPVPSFGDPRARVLVVGLAPAAHGGNRTGRIFTGDRSADFLFASLHRTGFANQPTSTHRGDGLRLGDMWIAAVNRCAPPANRPTPEERDNCLPYLEREIAVLEDARVLVCLGSFAWDGVLRALAALGHTARPKPRFGHAAEADVGPFRLLGTFHPSQQNTFTGKLTPAMLDAVFVRARELAAG
jgi:uracil-DNA glycosylase family 4